MNIMVTDGIHQQGDDSYLCWAYALASSLRNSLCLFVKKYSKLSKKEIKNCIAKIQSEQFHTRIRNEICMAIPTQTKEDGESQSMNLVTLMNRVRLIATKYN